MTGPLGRVGPIIAMVVVLIIGAAMGYLWGISGVQIVETGPWQLHPTYQGYYVMAVADGYAATENVSLAAEELSYLCATNVDAAFTEARDRASALGATTTAGNVDRLQAEVRPSVQQKEFVCGTNPVNAPVPSLVPIAVLLLTLAAVVGYGVWKMIRANETESLAPMGVSGSPAAASAPVGERARPTLPGLPGIGKKKPEESQETARSAAAQGAQISKSVEKTDYAAQGEPPIVQFMTTYLHGDDLYDDSFSIETPSGEFLGETGVGIAETLSSTDGKNVTGFEVWLFDKNDIRTVTKVLMSSHAFADDAIRAKLAPKGEAVMVEPGKRVALETASLKIQARVVDLSYMGGPVPPNGVFDRITIELAAWKRDASSGGGGAPAAPSRVSLPGAPSGGGTPPTGSPPIGG